MGNKIVKDINNRQINTEKPRSSGNVKKTDLEGFKPKPSKIQRNSGLINEVYDIDHSNPCHGGNGVINKAIHKTTGAVRAVKMIKKEEVEATQHETVMNEIRCMEALDHPSIPKIDEYFEDNANYYIVMEFIEGRDLFDELADDTCFTEEKAAMITKRALTSLNHMHHRHILHRDVKPENIMINDRQVKLIDFGSSIRFNKNEKLKEMTGSCYYIAPEVLDGSYNERCDIWSLGIILYIMLTGIVPYDGENEYEIIKQIRLDVDIFTISELETVSSSALDLLRKMLRRNGSERISTEEALQHPWLTQFRWQDKSIRKNNQICVGNCNLVNQLQTNLCQYMLNYVLDKDVLISIENLFLTINVSGDGCLTRNDIQMFLRQDKTVSLSISDKANLSKLIPYGRKTISFFEFSLKCISSDFLMKEEHLACLFKQACPQGTDHLSTYDFERFIGCKKIRDKLVFGKIVDKVSIENQSSLQYKEFKALVSSILIMDDINSSFKMP